MANLTDMEELLTTIPELVIRDYMREAMSCYMAGAYRGTLVLSYIALFDDLFKKLHALADVNSEAKLIFTEVFKKKSEQNVYERYLIDQLKSKNFISGIDHTFFEILNKLRNISAHPSGHKPSAEEARFIFSETITRFLSQRILSTTLLIDEIIIRLSNTNFFPSHVSSNVENIVAFEVSTLHHDAMPQLVAKLSDSVISSDISLAKNSCLFLTGLAHQDKLESNRALQAKLITAKADNESYADVLTQVLSSNGKLFITLEETTIARVRSIISKKISAVTNAISESDLNHPTFCLNSIASALPDENFVTTFRIELESLFEKRAHSEFIVRLVSGKPTLLSIYFPWLLASAGANDYAKANLFSNAAKALDRPLSELLNEDQSFKLIIAIKKAASSGAWSAKGMETSNFAGISLIRAKAIDYIDKNKDAAKQYIESTLHEHISIDEFVEFNFKDEETN
jgi:hypothetical protein